MLTLNMVSTLFLAIFVVCVKVLESKHLPSYIIPCSKSDPNLNECTKQHAIEALPFILKGDNAYKIPNFVPFYIPLVDIKGTEGINFQLKDLELYGLNTTQIKKVEFDLQNKHIHLQIFIPKSLTLAKYTFDGKIISFVLKAEGPAKISTENTTVDYFINYSLKTKADGKRYLVIDNQKLDMNFSKVHYYFGNLFGGNKLLSDNFNNLLNDNPKEVDELSGESNREVIKSIVVSLFNALFKYVPYDQIFID